jgi:iron-sulfur cluster repair protein YtfE (RIC family)
MITDIEFLDDATRPLAPDIDGVSEEQRERGRHLAMIHAMHLQELAQARRAMERVKAGEAAVSDVAEAVSAMQMNANYRLFGNLCGRECRMLEFHHTAEDQYLFPLLRDVDPHLRKVVERLSGEHQVIGQLLERLEAAAVRAVTTPGAETFGPLSEVFLTLERIVRSHFGYEQTQLEAAIGYWNVPI